MDVSLKLFDDATSEEVDISATFDAEEKNAKFNNSTKKLAVYLTTIFCEPVQVSC